MRHESRTSDAGGQRDELRPVPRFALSVSMKQIDLAKNNTMYYIVWDESKDARNLKKHGIAFAEAATVLFASPTLELEDTHHDEQRFIIIGFSHNAQLLTVVYTYRDEHQIRIISARKATTSEAKEYEKRI